jgi:hypothetical protein
MGAVAAQYAPLCLQYFKLVSFLCEGYAAKVAAMDPALLDMIVACLGYDLLPHPPLPSPSLHTQRNQPGNTHLFK